MPQKMEGDPQVCGPYPVEDKAVNDVFQKAPEKKSQGGSKHRAGILKLPTVKKISEHYKPHCTPKMNARFR